MKNFSISNDNSNIYCLTPIQNPPSLIHILNDLKNNIEDNIFNSQKFSDTQYFVSFQNQNFINQNLTLLSVEVHG